MNYVELAVEIGKLYRKMTKDLKKEIQNKDMEMNTNDLLFLAEIAHYNPPVTTNDMVKFGEHMIQNLMFNLTALEKKNYLSLKADDIGNLQIHFNDNTLEILKHTPHFTIPDAIWEHLKNSKISKIIHK